LRRWSIDSDNIVATAAKGTASMSRVRINCYSVSADGYAAGPAQSLENPMGVGGMALHAWVLPTRSFRKMHGGGGNGDGGTTGVDDELATAGMANLGAWILGRNMFGPVRGPWTDDRWKGWWGANPPYHVPVFVLTHHARAPLEMEGGTVFHFVTDGIHAALERARAAAGGKDVRIGGGAATVRQYLRAGLVDDVHLAYAPVILGKGETLLDGIDLPALGFERVRHATSEQAMHIVLAKKAA
jgi:dihydrofolate reductase